VWSSLASRNAGERAVRDPGFGSEFQQHEILRHANSLSPLSVTAVPVGSKPVMSSGFGLSGPAECEGVGESMQLVTRTQRAQRLICNRRVGRVEAQEFLEAGQFLQSRSPSRPCHQG